MTSMPRARFAPPDLDQLFPFPGNDAPADADTRALLALVAGDPIHERDRARVIEAILADAHAHDGAVTPDRVRQLLVDEHGNLIVYPRLLSSLYSVLSRSGALQVSGWTTSADLHGRNRGKPCRTYRLVVPA